MSGGSSSARFFFEAWEGKRDCVGSEMDGGSSSARFFVEAWKGGRDCVGSEMGGGNFAMAILLLVRAARTLKEEEAFQKLKRLWEDEWFDNTTLDYATLNGDPTATGRCKYSKEQKEWCETRLQFLTHAITEPGDKARVGIPLGRKSCHPPAPSAAQSALREDVALLSAADSNVSAQEPSAQELSAQELEAAPSPVHQEEPEPDLEVAVAPRKRRRKAVELGVQSGEPVQVAGPANDESPASKRGTTSRDGRLVRAKDGRPL
jgi:hypothetical protein